MTKLTDAILKAAKIADPEVVARALKECITTCLECGAGLTVEPDGTLPKHNVPGNPYWGCDNRDPLAKDPYE